MEPTAYDQILSKHADLSAIITKCATENRAPSAEETSQLNTLKSEIDAIRSQWESKGRDAFLAGLAPSAKKPESAQTVLKSGDSFARHIEGSYPSEFKGCSLAKTLKGYVTGDWTGAELESKALASFADLCRRHYDSGAVGRNVIDLARAQTRVLQAGASTVPMATATLRYARLTADPTASWTAEAANITPDAATFDSVLFTAHKLAAIIVDQ